MVMTSFDGGYIHQGCWSWGGDVTGTAVSRTRVAVQSRGPGNTHREVTYLSWAAPPYAYACGCVLAYAGKRLTIFNTYTLPTDQPIAHLRGQHPMTTSASETPAKWGANSHVDDDVVCRVEEGRPHLLNICTQPGSIFLPVSWDLDT